MSNTDPTYELINVTKEARDRLHALVSEPEMGEMSCSDFILQAVDSARAQLERRRAYVKERRHMVRSLTERDLSDEECDALLAKMDAVAPPPHA